LGFARKSFRLSDAPGTLSFDLVKHGELIQRVNRWQWCSGVFLVDVGARFGSGGDEELVRREGVVAMWLDAA
jgi:hypothetical protein